MLVAVLSFDYTPSIFLHPPLIIKWQQYMQLIMNL